MRVLSGIANEPSRNIARDWWNISHPARAAPDFNALHSIVKKQLCLLQRCNIVLHIQDVSRKRKFLRPDCKSAIVTPHAILPITLQERSYIGRDKHQLRRPRNSRSELPTRNAVPAAAAVVLQAGPNERIITIIDGRNYPTAS
jgi:hypothetical protein